MRRGRLKGVVVFSFSMKRDGVLGGKRTGKWQPTPSMSRFSPSEPGSGGGVAGID
jgi:hypothetical protein